jgi:hypothetical protein
MKKRLFITAGVTAVTIAGTGFGVASAATNTSSGNVGSSDIPRNVYVQERQAAVAEVLNTTTANVQAAHKNHTLKNLISNAGLTKKTFGEKVKSQLTTDLESKGYSQDQITIAMQHKQIVRLHHKANKEKKDAN